ncbi:dTMP kinase [Breznakiellaceae bacterium SP9]
MVLQNFAVFEGPDGSGTTTQLTLLKEHFTHESARLPPLYACAEPTNGPVGTLIRSFLHKEILLCPQTLALLFAADRNEHLYAPNGIVERCTQGALTVCDRYVLSSLVYQGLSCGVELPLLLNQDFPAPQLLLYFDIDPRVAGERIRARGKRDAYEYLEFQMKVREQYQELLSWYETHGTRVKRLNAEQSIAELAKEVWSVLRELPILNELVPKQVNTKTE